MNLTLKNETGLMRSVPTGLSWTGFIFTGFTMMTRGMIGKGIIYLIAIYTLQTMAVFGQFIVTATDGEEAGQAAGGIYFLLLSIPNVVFLFKLNKWTARHWLDRGYKPEGPGWAQWAPRYGMSISDELKVASAGMKDVPLITRKDVLGFILVGIILLLVAAASSGSAEAGQRTETSRPAAREAQSATGTRLAAGLRDVVRFPDSAWVLMEAKSLGAVLSGGEYSEPKRTRGKFIQVRFRVTNTTSEEETVLFTPTLTDSRRRIFQQMDSQDMYLPADAESMTLKQLPAGLKKEFQAIYEIPADATGLLFQARALADRGETVSITTGL